MSDFYENIVPSGSGTPPGGGSFTDPQATLAAAINAPPPQVQLPPKPNPDYTGIPGLALLSLAAGLTGRRQMGQSGLNQALDAVSNAASYAMAAKKEAQDRAQAQYGQELQAAQIKSNLTSQAQAQKKTQIDTAVDQVTAPMRVEQLQTAIATSRDEAQLKAIQVRMLRVSEGYQAQKQQAELDALAATTADKKAEAENRGRLADAALTTANAHAQTAQATLDRLKMEREAIDAGKKTGNFKIQQGLPGEVGTFTYQKPDGSVLTGEMPMDQAAAVKKATDDYKVLDKSNMLPPGTDQRTWVTDRMKQLVNPPSYQQAVQDMNARSGKVAPTATGTTPVSATPSAVTPTTPGATSPEQQAAIKYSQQNPEKGVAWTGADGIKYYIGGKEVTKAEAEARRLGGPSVGATNNGDLSRATPEQLWAAVSSSSPGKQYAIEELAKRGLLTLPTSSSASPPVSGAGPQLGPQ